MKNKDRPDVPKEKIIQVNNIHKIDFNTPSKPYKLIYFDWWYEVLVFFPFLFSYILVTLCAIFFSFRVKGKKNLHPLRTHGCITISNHCHYFDTVLANYVILPRHLYTAVVQRNFEVPIARRLLRALKAFPIPSNNGLASIKEVAKEVFKRKRHIHFLPEGNLVHLGQKIHRFRSGAFILSYLHQAPIIPMVYVLQPRKIFGITMKKNWVKITLVIGEPIYPPQNNIENSVPMDVIEKIMDDTANWMEETIVSFHNKM